MLNAEFPPASESAHQNDNSSKLAKRARNVALSAVAEQFLDAPELNLEMRAYLLESALPSVVISLEMLILEMERRKFDISTSNVTIFDNAPNKEQLTTSAALKKDLPLDKFDSLNWLGWIFATIYIHLGCSEN